MKILCTLLAATIAVTTIAQTTFKVEPKGSEVIWVGKKITGQHTGTIAVSSGSIIWTAGALVNAEIVIDMSTITVTDLSEGSAQRLVTHLNSTDFFNTSEFGLATFKTTYVEKIPSARDQEPNYAVRGDLTIKGITHPVAFTLLALQKDDRIHAIGTLQFDRTLYGIKYRSGQFFPDLGDKMIDDMIELTFDLVTQEQ